MAKVIYSWQGTKDNHLSIKRDETIRVLQQGQKWWSGEKDGSVGWFPKTFVQLEESNVEKETEQKLDLPYSVL